MPQFEQNLLPLLATGAGVDFAVFVEVYDGLNATLTGAGLAFPEPETLLRAMMFVTTYIVRRTISKCNLLDSCSFLRTNQQFGRDRELPNLEKNKPSNIERCFPVIVNFENVKAIQTICTKGIFPVPTFAILFG